MACGQLLWWQAPVPTPPPAAVAFPNLPQHPQAAFVAAVCSVVGFLVRHVPCTKRMVRTGMAGRLVVVSRVS